MKLASGRCSVVGLCFSFYGRTKTDAIAISGCITMTKVSTALCLSPCDSMTNTATTATTMDVTNNNTSSATEFLQILQTQVPTFLSDIVKELKERHNIDVTKYQADHVCWRTETIEEYTALVSKLNESSSPLELLIESVIGGRPIATFELQADARIHWEETGHEISVIEIPSPKSGNSSSYKSGLEHVEFVIGKQDTGGVSSGSSVSGSSNDDNRSAITSPINDEAHQQMFDAFIE